MRLLAETVHPAVRPDPDEARELVETLNRKLGPDGWMLAEAKQMSGRPVHGRSVMLAQILGRRCRPLGSALGAGAHKLERPAEHRGLQRTEAHPNPPRHASNRRPNVYSKWDD